MTECSSVYEPVCGINSFSEIKTYENICNLGKEKAKFLYNGEC